MFQQMIFMHSTAEEQLNYYLCWLFLLGKWPKEKQTSYISRVLGYTVAALRGSGILYNNGCKSLKGGHGQAAQRQSGGELTAHELQGDINMHTWSLCLHMLCQQLYGLAVKIGQVSTSVRWVWFTLEKLERGSFTSSGLNWVGTVGSFMLSAWVSEWNLAFLRKERGFINTVNSHLTGIKTNHNTWIFLKYPVLRSSFYITLSQHYLRTYFSA